jgi:hypothetical protein
MLGGTAYIANKAGQKKAHQQDADAKAQTEQMQHMADDAAQQAVAGAQAESAPVADAAPTGLTDDRIAALSRLGDLKEKGILTDEEFAAEKAKILNG